MVPGIFRTDLEERKTVWQLLQRVEPEQRIAWLIWCADTASHGVTRHIVTGSAGTVADVYFDWLSLCGQLGLDWKRSRENLESRVRVKCTPLFWAGR